MADLTAGDLVAGTGYVLEAHSPGAHNALSPIDGLTATIGPDEEGARPITVHVDPTDLRLVERLEAAIVGAEHVRYTATAGDEPGTIYLDRLEDATAPGPIPVPGPGPADAPPPPPAGPLEGPLAQLCPRCGHAYGTLPLVKSHHDGALVHRHCPEEVGPIEAAAASSPAAAALAAELEAIRRPDASDVAKPDASAGPSSEPSSTPRPPRPIAPARRGPREEEGKPWQRYNTDGSVNLGSYAYTAAVGTVELATRLLLDRARTAALEAGTPIEAPSRKVVTYLARTLLTAADTVQAAIRNDGQVDRQDNSHTRARGAIRDALDLYPVPFGATDEDRADWLEALTGHATMLLEVALTVVEPVR